MSKGQTLGYVRVSSLSQSLERQEIQADKIYTEKLSGKDRARPELEAMIDYAREGDEIRVWSIDRLARNLFDLESLIREIVAKGASVSFTKENLLFAPVQEGDKNNLYSKLMLQLLGAFAEFERNILLERQREGIAKAKQAGKYKGRKQIVLSDEQKGELQRKVADKVPKAVIARDLGISRSRLYKELDALGKIHS
jgi:DNA invertase Pin-like site-specific DNA recombinase